MDTGELEKQVNVVEKTKVTIRTPRVAYQSS